ncbi:MAG: hypothetical protein PHW11_08730 [Anaerolineaceae bacterium]|nr:hypothetical protein [Anaerolineaceae bacterium]MDD4042966.1 hypothetical protein [Anaerolineaceae bacterium]
MNYVIRFLAEFEVPIYLVLGIVALVYLRRVLMALEEKRSAIFGLEREAAQRKVVSATSVLILVGLLTVGEFIVATFLAGELSQEPTFATPTIEVLTTATTTLPGVIPTDATPTPTLYPQADIEGIDSACINDILEIESPEHLEEISGVVELIGSVNTENLGSYKYEYSTMGEPNWQTIAAGSGTRIDESLGSWYTSDLVAGEYMLRLVALDNDGVDQSACVIVVTVTGDQ